VIQKVINWIVPKSLRETQSQRIVASLLVQLLSLGLLGCVAHAVLFAIAGADSLLAVAAITSIVFLLLLFAFRVVKKSRYIYYGFVICLYITYTAEIFFTGGGNSPILMHMILLPFLGLLPGVRRPWYIVLAGSVIIIASFVIATVAFSYPFPDELVGTYEVTFNVVSATFPFLVLVSIIPMFMKNVAHSNERVKKAFLKLKSTNKRLVESEKLASLGQLTAGIAHEINNPVNYTLGSAQRLKQNIEDLVDYETYRGELWVDVENALKKGDIIDEQSILKTTVEKNQQRKEDIQYTELLEELVALMESVENGAERTAEIVKGLRTFSRLDDAEFKLVDIKESVDSTLVLLKSKTKGEIKINKKYQDLPLVECNPSKINQVLLNVISNAIQAIQGEGFINIFLTYNVGLQQVTIKVEDSGKGIPKSIGSEIFNPFFTTKEVGEGTGLGLAMCRSIIEDHNGRLFFRSLPGVGTTFFIELPIAQSEERKQQNLDIKKSEEIDNLLL